MCPCLLQVGMLIMGIFALAKGEVQLTRRKVVRGLPARVIGIILMVPFPSQVLLGIVWGVVLGLQGTDPLTIQERIMRTAPFIDVAVTIGCALLAVILGVVLGKPPRIPQAEPADSLPPLGPPQPPSNNPYEPPANPFSDR